MGLFSKPKMGHPSNHLSVITMTPNKAFKRANLLKKKSTSLKKLARFPSLNVGANHCMINQGAAASIYLKTNASPAAALHKRLTL